MAAERTTLAFDDIIQRVGELGKYQIIQFCLAGILLCAASVISLSMMFVAAAPSHICAPSIQHISFNSSRIKNGSFNSSFYTSNLPFNSTSVISTLATASPYSPSANSSSSFYSHSPLDLLSHQLYLDLGIIFSHQKLMTWFIPPADSHAVDDEASSDSDADRVLLLYRYSCCTRFVYGDGSPKSNQIAYSKLLRLIRKYLELGTNFSNSSVDSAKLLYHHERIHRFLFSQNISTERCNEWIYSNQYYYSTVVTQV